MNQSAAKSSTWFHALPNGVRLLRSVAWFYVFNGVLVAPLGRRFWALRYRNEDPWNYTSSPYELGKYERTLRLLPTAPNASGVHEYVLEVGCSEGVFTSMLARSGKVRSILGVDVATKAIERARLRCQPLSNVELRLGDVRELTLEHPVSAVFCAEVLSHMRSWKNIRAICEKLVSVLVPGGALLLVDSYPMGRFLHKPFRRNPSLRLMHRDVVQDSFRPYVISVFQRV